MPDSTLYSRIRSSLAEANWIVDQFYNESFKGDAASVTFEGMVVSTNGRFVPQCSVQMAMRLHSGSDVEARTRELMAVLLDTPDCYPQQDPTFVEYIEGEDGRRRQVVARVNIVCRGV